MKGPFSKNSDECFSSSWSDAQSDYQIRRIFPIGGQFDSLLSNWYFFRNRLIDLIDRITSHKLPETSIFASDFGEFTTVGLNCANRTLTDRESHLRSGYGVVFLVSDRVIGGRSGNFQQNISGTF